MPHKFTDAAGRDWSLALSIGAAKRVKEHPQTNLDLLDDPKALDTLLRNSYLLANVLWLLCEDQAKTANVADKDFGEGLAGDAIEQATNALLEAMVDFFPSSRRDPLRQALATMKEAQAKANKMIQGKLTSPAMASLMDRELRTMSDDLDQLLAGGSSGKRQAALAGHGSN